MSRAFDPTLYLVTDTALSRPRPVADVVRAAVAGGVTTVQVRDKTASRWQCIKTPGKPSCGGLGAAAHRIEAAVDGFMIDLLSNPTHLDITTIGERPKNLPTMQDLDQRRSALAVALADGQLTLEDHGGRIDAPVKRSLIAYDH